MAGTCQPGNGPRGVTNTKPQTVSDPLPPLSLPLPSTLNHLRCTHLKHKSRTTTLVLVPSSGFYLLGFCLCHCQSVSSSVTPAPGCALHAAVPAHIISAWSDGPPSSSVRPELPRKQRRCYFPASEGQRLLAGGSRSAHGMVPLCRWMRRESPFPEQEPPPPFPPSCHSGQGDNRHSRISAPLNVQLFLH